MSTNFQKTRDIQESSEALMQAAKEAMEHVDVFLREQGIDPEKLKDAMPSLMNDEVSDEVANRYAEINHDIEREVALKRRELGLEEPAVQTSKRPRSVV